MAAIPATVAAAAMPPVTGALSKECVKRTGLSVLPDMSDEDNNDVGIVSVLRADKEEMGIVSVVEGKLVISVTATIAKVVIVKVATGILN
jgi:hypothetical protein